MFEQNKRFRNTFTIYNVLNTLLCQGIQDTSIVLDIYDAGFNIFYADIFVFLLRSSKRKLKSLPVEILVETYLQFSLIIILLIFFLDK